MDVRFRVHFSVLKADIWRCITQTMTPKWQQSEEAEAAGRSLSEGRIMSVQGPERSYPEIWLNPGQMQSKREQKKFAEMSQ